MRAWTAKAGVRIQWKPALTDASSSSGDCWNESTPNPSKRAPRQSGPANVGLDVHSVNESTNERREALCALILPGRNNQNNRIVLGLLEAVERESAQSQRRLAAELGIALGLVNIYLKRCVNKGLLKMAQAPARRYAYYLTPQGFAEKARLTLEYMSYSFELFRRARADCASVFEAARSRGFGRVVLAGVSDLAEIATICALEAGIQIAAIVDQQSSLSTFSGVSVVASFEKVEGEFQAVVVTDLIAAQETFAAAVERMGTDRVLVPSMLGIRVGTGAGMLLTAGV